MTYPFLNFNFIPHLSGACDYLSMLGLKLIYVSKKGMDKSLHPRKIVGYIYASMPQRRFNRRWSGIDE